MKLHEQMSVASSVLAHIIANTDDREERKSMADLALSSVRVALIQGGSL